ncbi:MAG: alcohol dehydrogenase catalytic domain-containing protein [Actinomycetes bacterium]
MRAVRLHAKEDIRIDDLPDVVPGPGQVRVAPAHNGICGSDLHMYFQGSFGVTDGPIVLGHEFSGVVDAVGDGVTRVAVGTPVAVRPFHQCNSCYRCAQGHTHLCKPLSCVGCGAEGGGLAEHVLLPEHMVFALPDGVSLERGALVEPMAVSYQGILRADLTPDARSVVFGAGPIGIGTFLGLRALGHEGIVMVEPSPVRRAAVEALGAEVVLDPAVHDVAAEVRARTGGRGADAVFECAGVPASFRGGLSSLAARGRLVIVAIYEEIVPWQPAMLMMDELEIRSALAYQPGVFEAVLDLMAEGHYQPNGWVEHIPLDAVVDEGFVPLRRGERLKVLVDVGG